MPEKPIYAVGLDAGSTKTRMVVCAIEDELRLLGCAEVESRGWSKGTIKDQRAVAEAIFNPPPLTPGLERAIDRYKGLIKSSR